jgi:hypothetical protein
MRIQGNYRVGIRRDNPDKTLSVLGEFSITSDVNITAPGFANYISNFNNGSGLLLKKVGSGSGNYYQAQAHNGLVLFNIDRDGDGYFLDKVSVGTTSKTHSFNVGLGHSSDAVVHIEDPTTGSGGFAGLTLRDRGNADADAETWQLRVTNNGQLGIGELDDAETSFQERLTLDQDGEVGIGTTNPTDDLHVDGNVRITGTLKDASNLAGTAGQVLSATSTGTAWIENSPLSLSDTDTDTKIQVEETADDDLIRFDLEGTEQFVMDGPRLEVLNSGASVFIGQNAGANDDLSTNSNVFVGFNSGSTNVSGALNTAVGAHTLEFNTTGANNTANGAYALRNNTTGGLNTALGRSAMQGNISGNTNSAIGYHALSSNQSGSANVAVGYYAMIQNITGTQNTALGTTALQNNTSGNYNTAQGYASLRSNTEGDNNTALGYTALGGNSTGNDNTVIGHRALVSNTTGSKNTVVGSRALINLNITDDTASNNTAIGFEAGSGIVTGTHNTILGANVGGLPSALSNNIIIADGQGNQRIRVVANGDLGIGTTAPTDDLHVDGDVRITGAIKDSSNNAGSAGQVLSATAAGTAWVDAAGALPTGTQNGNTLYFDGTDWVENTNLVHNELETVNPMLTHAGSIAHGTGGALLINPRAVAVSGNYAFVAAANSDAIEVVDISNPATPVHAAAVTNTLGGPYISSPNTITISGNYAYVTSYFSNALEIIDISDPLNPTHTGAILDGDGGAILEASFGVAVSGNYAYVGSYLGDAIEVVDISDPFNPTHEASISHGGSTLLDGPTSIAISGNYAYVVSQNSDALEIINISNPASPTHAASIVNGGGGSGGALLDTPFKLKISGDYAYVASLNSDALEIINISDPLNPTHSGSISHGGSTLLEFANNVFIYENYAFVTASQSHAVEVVDITDPANPTHVTSIVDGAGGALLNGANDIVISGNYAYVAAEGGNALEVLDVSDFTEKVQGVGIGTASPTAQLHTTGTVRFENFGAGTLQTDANGNLSVSSDERLKNTVSEFEKGLKEILALKPINYRWNALSGLEQEELYIGFSAQNVQSVLPEAVGQDQKGYLTLSDRPILAATVNAIKELNAKNEALEAENKKLKALLEHVLKRLKKLEE